MTKSRQSKKEKVQLTPRSSGRPSEPTSWQWGHSHRRAHWAHSAGNTARATFQGDLSDPQESSCSCGRQGGVHSLPRSRKDCVTHCQIPLDGWFFAVMCSGHFPRPPPPAPSQFSSYPIATPLIHPLTLFRAQKRNLTSAVTGRPRFGNIKWYNIKL